MKILPRQQTPFLQRLNDPLFEKKRVTVWLHRQDIIHPHISGNKWWKLSGNFDKILKEEDNPTIITFGGAWSNHLYATAAACKVLSLRCVGLVRGEITDPNNKTLQFCQSAGMELVPIARSAYREKDLLAQEVGKDYPNTFFIPEGGTSAAAIRACSTIPDNRIRTMDHICLPVGTGGTMAGIIGGLNPGQNVTGFSVLKGDFLADTIAGWLSRIWPDAELPEWHVNTAYHAGGYARITRELIAFIQQFYQRHGVLLDPVYTGKMMFGLYDLIRRDQFREGKSICAMHTGGLQGWHGITERYGIDPATF